MFARYFSEKNSNKLSTTGGLHVQEQRSMDRTSRTGGRENRGREGTCKEIVNHKYARASDTVLDGSTRAAPEKRPDARVGRFGKIELSDESSLDESEG